MIRLPLPAIAIAAVFLVSCAAKQPPPAAVQPPPAGSQPSALARQSTAVKIADGAVTQISSGHGNAYTSIGPDQYVVLGLEPGSLIHVAFADTAVTLVVGRDYAEVPTGTPLAVLHREGLTFAVRDGNFSTAFGVGVGALFCISTVPAQP